MALRDPLLFSRVQSCLSSKVYMALQLLLLLAHPLLGSDVIAQAQSGTGKTATFSISVRGTCEILSDYVEPR